MTFYVFLAAELKEKLQSEMERNENIIEVSVMRKCRSVYTMFLLSAYLTSLPPPFGTPTEKLLTLI